MKSRLLGKVSLDEESLGQDLEILRNCPPAPPIYSEFCTGTFNTYMLRNATANESDYMMTGRESAAKRTKLGGRLKYIDQVIDRLFDPEMVRVARITEIRAGMLFPHKDMVEFGGEQCKITRLHLLLATNKSALHSESDTVFHMQPGDLWYLNWRATHAAINRSRQPRYSLMIDLDSDRFDESELARNPTVRPGEPMFIEREPLSDGQFQSLMNLKALVCPDNAFSFFTIFAKLSFYKNVSAGDSLRMAQDFFRETSQEKVALDYIRFLHESREIDQRFFIHQHWSDF